METVTPTSAASKQELYRTLCDQVPALIGSEKNFIANAANTVSLLYHSLPDINWLGFYFLEGEELVLGPFQGKPAAARIPVGKGVCGKTAASGETTVVPDVNRFPDHITCDPASMSEIVVPLLNWGKLIGVLDVDSASLNRFDDDDQEGLESIASVFLASQGSGEVPDFSDEAAGVE